ncbi:MAG: prepilin peptidase [Lachnospiraceae bacterium]|nr:prepilin peptidase [Lachnospiraceae bacterium]
MTTESWILETVLYAMIFLYGIVIGSFLNVCILRIPLKESVAKERSHCMSCGYQLAWFDLIPLFSYIFLGGKCRKCKTHISLQYPLVEALNGVLYVLIFLVNGWSIDSVIYCLLTSALIVLSVIDFRTYEIPIGINLFILALGLIHLVFHLGDWLEYGIGLLAVSGFLWILYQLSGGTAIGGGDVKLMGAAGLLLGWKLAIVAFLLGCILGSVIHIIRMKMSGAERRLAMGPYLAAGIFIAALWGNQFLNWYLGSFTA